MPSHSVILCTCMYLPVCALTASSLLEVLSEWVFITVLEKLFRMEGFLNLPHYLSRLHFSSDFIYSDLCVRMIWNVSLEDRTGESM